MSGAAAERKQLAAREKKATDAEREKIEKILKPKRIAPGLEVGPLMTDKGSPTMKSPLSPRKLDPIEASPIGREKKPVGKKKEKFDPSSSISDSKPPRAPRPHDHRLLLLGEPQPSTQNVLVPTRVLRTLTLLGDPSAASLPDSAPRPVRKAELPETEQEANSLPLESNQPTWCRLSERENRSIETRCSTEPPKVSYDEGNSLQAARCPPGTVFLEFGSIFDSAAADSKVSHH